MLLNGGVYAHQRNCEAVDDRAVYGSARTVESHEDAWMGLCRARAASADISFGPHSYGHTGFTGTSIYIDPDRQLFVVLLTNRVNPTRENMKIAKCGQRCTMR